MDLTLLSLSTVFKFECACVCLCVCMCVCVLVHAKMIKMLLLARLISSTRMDYVG